MRRGCGVVAARVGRSASASHPTRAPAPHARTHARTHTNAGLAKRLDGGALAKVKLNNEGIVSVLYEQVGRRMGVVRECVGRGRSAARTSVAHRARLGALTTPLIDSHPTTTLTGALTGAAGQDQAGHDRAVQRPVHGQAPQVRAGVRHQVLSGTSRVLGGTERCQSRAGRY